MIEEIPELGYQGKHRKRSDHSRGELLGSEIIEKNMRSQGRRVSGRSGRGFPKGELVRKTKTERFRIE